MGFCMLCAGDYNENHHEQSEHHQKASENLTLKIISHGFCPWHNKLTKLKSCKVKEHKKMRQRLKAAALKGAT